jgi:predicted secreted protein
MIMANISKNLVIKIDASAIAHTQSFSYGLTKDMADITTLDSSGGWKQFLPILKEQEITFDALVVRDPSASGSYGNLLNSFIGTDASITILIEDPLYTTKKISTQGYLQALNLSVRVGEVQTYSGTIKPTGPPSLI